MLYSVTLGESSEPPMRVLTPPMAPVRSARVAPPSGLALVGRPPLAAVNQSKRTRSASSCDSVPSTAGPL